MVGDDRQSTAFLHQVNRGFEQRLEGAQLVVDFDAKRLKDLSMELVLLASGGEVLGGFHQIACPGNAPVFADTGNGVGDFIGPLQFTVQAENPCQIFDGVRRRDISSGQSVALVHPHVQRRIEPGGESARALVELVGANAQVGQQAIDAADAVEAEEVARVPEVFRNQREPFIRQRVGVCIGVLIKPEQATVRVQRIENEAGMTATAERRVHVDSARKLRGTNPCDASVGQNRNVVGAGIHGLILVVGFEVLADFFGEGAEIKIFGVIEDALVVAGLAPEFNLLAEAGYDDLVVSRQLNAGVLEQQGGNVDAAGSVEFDVGGPLHEFALEQLVLAVVPAQPGHLAVHFIPFGLRVNHQAPFKNVAVNDQPIVQHGFQLLSQARRKHQAPFGVDFTRVFSEQIEHDRLEYQNYPRFPTFSHLMTLSPTLWKSFEDGSRDKSIGPRICRILV